MVPEGFTGVIEDFAAPTRTSLADGNYIAWSQNDRISVFQGSSAPDCFRVSDASVGNTKASFVAVSLEGSTEDNLISFYQENLAMYPYDGKAYCKALYTDSDRVTVYEIGGIPYPEQQTYVDKSFPSDALVMVAVTGSLSDRNLRFKAAGSVLRFKVRGSTVLKSIKVEGNGGELLSGKGRVKIDLVNGGIAAEVYNGSSSVTLDCGSGVALDGSDAKVFMLCIPPTEFESGFKVTFTDINGEEDVRTVSKSVNARRGHIFGMSEITFGEPSESTGEYDYIDENGINQGPGVEIDGLVWAPVNCGYHESDYPWGKLYQWGRKYGQGYDGDLYDINGNKTGTYTDATVPTVKDGSVSLITGQSESNEDYFYKNDSEPWDWLSSPNGYLWRIGFESRLIKTEYDPCPEGWRVPTYAEFEALAENKSSWATDSKGQVGYWFSGSKPYSSSVPRVFFPAAGRRDYYDGKASDRGLNGYYWSSVSDVDFSYYFYFLEYGAYLGGFNRGCGSSVRCVQDDAGLVPVTSVSLNESSLAIDEGDTFTLSVTISPSDANHQSAHWWSDDESIATVDQTGVVTAVSAGTATITAMAGMKSATCRVTVNEKVTAQEGEYVDEYGVNHGQGVEIDGVVWAPVNCGYHESDYPWGKLYQWGRKYGQGYTTSYDASAPDLMPGPVSLSVGESDYNGRYFFSIESSRNWLANQIDWLWNIGSEDSPIKTEYDPCPEGWRVPTSIELSELAQNNAPMKTENGQRGRWFGRGTSDFRIFLPSAGFLSGRGSASYRNDEGYYWSSTPFGDLAYYLVSASDEVDVKYYFLRTLGFSIRCVKDDGELIPVSSLTLSETSLSLEKDNTSVLSATIAPSNANHQSAFWWSEDPLVATVDEDGTVTAVSSGTTTITAMAGMQIAVCKVTVTTASDQNVYIDENGINQGPGVEIDGVVWAPVNCGYHETDFKYGKLYQWGRKYGQGYDGSLNDDDGNGVGAYEDASVPVTKKGPESLTINRSDLYAKIFYTVDSSPYDWLSPQNDKLWNSGDEDNPVKTEYDPCPEGWRVPTFAELDNLRSNSSSWTSVDGQSGYFFSGSQSSGMKVFFPAAGRRSDDGDAYDRGRRGSYWSSSQSESSAFYLFFENGLASAASYNRAYGYSVRCVKYDGELIPVSSLTLSETSLSLQEDETSKLSATITPSNATHQSAFWWSEDPLVATVDQNGIVTAVSAGTTTITAMAGMQIATCKVTVTTASDQNVYIDENGINQGPGVEIDGVVWAPVNCGYHESDYPWGKLYQWGRKYGQGYTTSYDASARIAVEGPVSLSVGQSEYNEGYFYTNEANSSDWLIRSEGKLWNLSTADSPVKSEYDPCPDGWRVPTSPEMRNLKSNHSTWTSDDKGQKGYWFSGSQTYSSSVPRVFLPAAGSLHGGHSGAYDRGIEGEYWTSYHGSYPQEFRFTSSELVTPLYYCSYGFSVRCVKYDGELIPVSSLSLSETSLTLEKDNTSALSATITPSNANHQSAFWWSEDESVATVDRKGMITAVSAGTTTITAMAGMQIATCEVTVTTAADQSAYIDEYGINQGHGVEIDGVVWAPVNCGYHETDFKYGKLYQWGRKYGQGYNGNLYDMDLNVIGKTSDAVAPDLVEGRVPVEVGNHRDNENTFYIIGLGKTVWGENNVLQNADWVDESDEKLWNSGTEESPVKTGYDPCPDGWRVPTRGELMSLVSEYSLWTQNDKNQTGYWFSGSLPFSEDVPRIFLPTSGSIDGKYGSGYYRNAIGEYWSSMATPTDDEADLCAEMIVFDRSSVSKAACTYRNSGLPVRCVQE